MKENVNLIKILLDGEYLRNTRCIFQTNVHPLP